MSISSPVAVNPADAMAYRHILLVEDNPGDADLTCERLAIDIDHPVEVSHAATLAQAMALLATRPKIDAVILDLNLPDAHGVETVQRLKGLVGSLPIIAMSGQVDDELRLKVRAEGADDLFGKAAANTPRFWPTVLQMIDRRRVQQRQFQALLDATPDGIVLVNAAGAVRYVNQAAVSLFGRTREDLMREPLGFSVVDGEAVDIRISRRDGHRDCEMRVVQLAWDDEQTWLASVRDVTERRRHEDLQARSRELEAQNHRMAADNLLKNQFLANMSHELRTPLNAIIGFSQLLSDGTVSPESPKFKKFLDHILGSGEHLRRLISDTLDMAQVEAGKMGFAAEAVDLLQLTLEVAASLELMAASKRLQIEVDFDASLTDIELDPVRYKQVLYNYLSNALKFAPVGSTVGLQVNAHDDQQFHIEVSDSGQGIAPNDIGKLFTEFSQLDDGSAKRHQGTGLGLALTKRLVEAQGGTVGVNSLIGHGSKFFAVLPRRPIPDPG